MLFLPEPKNGLRVFFVYASWVSDLIFKPLNNSVPRFDVKLVLFTEPLVRMLLSWLKLEKFRAKSDLPLPPEMPRLLLDAGALVKACLK